MNNENYVALGIQATNLLDNQAFQYAVEDLKHDMFNRWLATDLTDTANREAIYQCTFALEMMISKLSGLVVKAENELTKQINDE
jgi:hypothetical protein